jgi:hypothetical protein
MADPQKEKFAIALLEMIDKKREEIKTLTSQIIEWENDPKNVVKIKQNIQSILNAVASISNKDNNDLEIVKLMADVILNDMRGCREDNYEINPRSWDALIPPNLEDFCIHANCWNPIRFDFNKKGLKIDFKNINFGININK